MEGSEYSFRHQYLIAVGDTDDDAGIDARIGQKTAFGTAQGAFCGAVFQNVAAAGAEPVVVVPDIKKKHGRSFTKIKQRRNIRCRS